MSEKEVERILIPYFGEHYPEKARKVAFDRVKDEGEIYLLHITDEAISRRVRYMTGQLGDDDEPVKTFRDSLKKLQRDAAEDYIDKIKEKASDKGISVKELYVEGDPAEEILKVAEEYSIQLIVLEELREKMIELIFGGEVDYLRKRASCEVLKVS